MKINTCKKTEGVKIKIMKSNTTLFKKKANNKVTDLLL